MTDPNTPEKPPTSAPEARDVTGPTPSWGQHPMGFDGFEVLFRQQTHAPCTGKNPKSGEIEHFCNWCGVILLDAKTEARDKRGALRYHPAATGKALCTPPPAPALTPEVAGVVALLVQQGAVPMLLFCPRCLHQHIDVPNPDKGWTNPPHRSHLCGSCGHVWRPADVPTTGVADIRTRGQRDESPVPRDLPISALVEAVRDTVGQWSALVVERDGLRHRVTELGEPLGDADLAVQLSAACDGKKPLCTYVHMASNRLRSLSHLSGGAVAQRCAHLHEGVEHTDEIFSPSGLRFRMCSACTSMLRTTVIAMQEPHTGA